MTRLQTICTLLLAALLHVAQAAVPALKTGQISAAVRFGCLSPAICYANDNRSLLPPHAVVYKSGGYDGQFYFYSAMRLYRGLPAVFDSQPFRLARIGYPALAGFGAVRGPEALLVTLFAIPLLLHLGVIFALRHDWLRACIFALNPISALSAGLFLADGMALSLIVLALHLQFREKQTLWTAGAVFGLSVLAMLTKETAAVAALVSAFVFLRSRSLVHIAPIVAVIPMLLWWQTAGFSPIFAAKRGLGLEPGVFHYLQRPDTLWSSRSLLFVWAALGLSVLYRLDLVNLRARAGGALVLCGIILPIVASSEYWDNFANVLRLFLPAAAGFVLAARKTRGRIVAAYFTAFSLLILSREFRAMYDVQIW